MCTGLCIKWFGSSPGRVHSVAFLCSLTQMSVCATVFFFPKSEVSLHASQVAHQAGAYPGFRSMKRLGVFLLHPGWDASPSQGYPQH